MELTQDYLKSILNYDPNTGIFTWKVKKSIRSNIGDYAGSFDDMGYVVIKINKKLFKAHRLAFLWMTGEMPNLYVDHINHIESDNRFLNLRLATKKQNNSNVRSHKDSSSIYLGVSKYDKKWLARIKKNGKQICIGYFKCEIDAAMAYDKYAKEIHGEFANLNFK